MTSYTISEESDNIVLLKELVEEAEAKYGYYQAPPRPRNHRGYRQCICGFYRVRKQKTNTRKGYTFQYKIVRKKQVTRFSRQNLLDLKEEVDRRGLPWEVSNELLARKLVSDEGLNWEDFE